MEHTALPHTLNNIELAGLQLNGTRGHHQHSCISNRRGHGKSGAFVVLLYMPHSPGHAIPLCFQLWAGKGR